MKKILLATLSLFLLIACKKDVELIDFGKRVDANIKIWVTPRNLSDSIALKIGGKDVKIEWGVNGAYTITNSLDQTIGRKLTKRTPIPICIWGYNLVSIDNRLGNSELLTVDSIEVGYLAATTNLSLAIAQGQQIDKYLDMSYCTQLLNVHFEGINHAGILWNKSNFIKTLTINQSKLVDLNLQWLSRLTDLECAQNKQLKTLTLPTASIVRSINASGNALETIVVYNAKWLRQINISSNQLSAASLNSIFDWLPTVDSELACTINIASNPGALASNAHIAQQKGWIVIR